MSQKHFTFAVDPHVLVLQISLLHLFYTQIFLQIYKLCRVKMDKEIKMSANCTLPGKNRKRGRMPIWEQKYFGKI